MATKNQRVLDYCKDHGCPLNVRAAFIKLGASYTAYTLGNLESAWNDWDELYSEDLVEAIEELFGYDALVCERDGEIIRAEDSTYIDGDIRVCNHCRDSYYYRCYDCGEYFTDTTTVNSNEYCERDVENNFIWCEDCDEWQDSEHTHDCGCDVPVPYFRFPANGSGTVREDERLTIELPGGIIDDQGINQIYNLLLNEGPTIGSSLGLGVTGTALYERYYSHISPILDEIGREWQTKKGNFTRRLSSAFHKHKVKLPPKVITQVGNIAKEHSSGEQAWHVEFTRDLNQSADFFFNEGSCWWGGYAESRCCFKNWGGVAMRSFDNEGSRHPNGRAWVQPINEELEPTHDTLNAHGFILYNSYGKLSGYIGVRIIAHLTGKTYKKIDFNADPQYINSGGYLIADAETCANTDGITFSHYGSHNTRDAHTQIGNKKELVNA